MLDFAHLPRPQNGTVDYFPGYTSSVILSGPQVWNKPKNCMFIRILCIGGGAGGSSGFPSATTNARGGGAGGGSAAIGYVTIPAVFLPDRLYIYPGSGGTGGASSTTVSNQGNNGQRSTVTVAPDPSPSIYRICSSDSGLANGGVTASAGSAGTGGSGAVASAISSNNLGFEGHHNSIAGQIGANGGTFTGAVGASRSYPTTGLLLSGGAGGAGGAGFAGGNITQPASQDNTLTLFQTLTGGAAGTVGSPTGENGKAGVELYQPLLATGGSGGGSSFDGTARGGDGGDGGFGCGGGGGGAGGTDGGGAGGNGGPGLIVIHTW